MFTEQFKEEQAALHEPARFMAAEHGRKAKVASHKPRSAFLTTSGRAWLSQCGWSVLHCWTVR